MVCPSDNDPSKNYKTSKSAPIATSEHDEQLPIGIPYILAEMKSMFNDMVYHGRPVRDIPGVDAAFSPLVNDNLGATELVKVSDGSISERRVWAPHEDATGLRDDWGKVSEIIQELWPTIPKSIAREYDWCDVAGHHLDFGWGVLPYSKQHEQNSNKSEKTNSLEEGFSVADPETQIYD